MTNAYSGTIRKIIESSASLDGLTDEEKGEITEFLADNCVMRIHIDLLDRLPKEKRDAFYKVSERLNSDKIKEFLDAELPDWMDIVQDTTRRTVQEFNRLQSE